MEREGGGGGGGEKGGGVRLVSSADSVRRVGWLGRGWGGGWGEADGGWCFGTVSAGLRG